MFLKDKGKTFSFTLDETTGFLTSNVVLARTGVQEYFGAELQLSGEDSRKTFGVFRSPDEVFDRESVKSFTNLVVTDDHPSDFVTVDNVQNLQKGQVSQVKRDGDVLKGVVTITNKDQISKILSGKIEVSVGYSNNLIEEMGNFDGKPYQFKQTKIVANHLAVVDAGRCGSKCKLTNDKKGVNSMFTITIDGIEYQTEDKQLAQAVKKMQDGNKSLLDAAKKKADEAEEEKEEMKKEKDKAEAAKDALEKSKVSDSDISKMVADRAALIEQCKSILGDKMVDCMDCPKEMKVAVIDHVIPDMDLENKSDDYINAAFDMAVKNNKKSEDKNEKLSDDILKDKDGNEITRDSARNNYMKDHLGI